MGNDSLGYLFLKSKRPGVDQEKVKRDVCEKVLISKISGSDLLKNNVVLKGGVLLRFLTNGQRGFTKDIDIDLIDHRVTEEALVSFFKEVNQSPVFPLIQVSLLPGHYEEIKLADYHGARVGVLISDGNDSLSIKADIGLFDKQYSPDSIKTYQISFEKRPVSFKAESNDLIIAEKLSTFAIYGTANERVKDLLDAYWLIRNVLFSKRRIIEYLDAIVVRKRQVFTDVRYALTKIKNTLSDQSYVAKMNIFDSWVKENPGTIVDFIVSFISELEYLPD
jgi:hypothetical protein